MIYLKSAVVGLATVVAIFLVIPAFIVLVQAGLFLWQNKGAGTEISIREIHWHYPNVAQASLVLLVFAAGFLWQLRRLKNK